MARREQEIRFCTTADGVRLAYARLGSGPPLLRVGSWLTHLEYDGTSPVWVPWLTELSRNNTLIRYDPRGCGLSDRDVAAMMSAQRYAIGNLDATIIAQAPRVAPFIDAMRANIAHDLGCDVSHVSVKATTTERLGFAGREEGIAALATVLLEAMQTPGG